MKFLKPLLGVFVLLGSIFFASSAFAVAPQGTNLNAAESYTEDTALNLIDIVASDIDSSTLTATLTLSSSAVGTLSTGTSGVTTSTYNAGTGVWTASGAIAEVNLLLAGVIFTPFANGNASFTIATSISDGGSSVSGVKAVTGVAVNDAPTATNLSAAESYTEDTTLNLIDIVASDIDSATVTATLTLSNTSAGTLSTATSGAVTSTFSSGVWTASGARADVNTLLAGVIFTPTTNFNATFTITTNVSDGALSVSGVKAVTGVAVNDAPVLDSSRSPVMVSVAQDAGAPVGAVGTAIMSLVDAVLPTGGLDNVTDVDSGASLGIAITGTNATNITYYYSLNSGTTWNALGSVSNTSARLLAANGTNRIYGQPAPSFNGTVSSALTFSVWDQTSGTDGGTASTASNGGTSAFSTATDTANLTVTIPNAAPVAVDDAYTVDEDTITSLSVLTNDTDANNDTLTVSAVTTPGHGSAVITGGGASVSYTPSADFNGIDSFDYTVSDGNGGTATGTVRMTVAPINDAPVATDDSFTLLENSSTTGLYVVSNDTDVDGDLVSIVFVGSPDHGGAASIQGNNIMYTPAADFVGTETFSYTISDSSGGTDSATVSINVTSTDVTAPDTFIISSSSPSIDSSTATFEFESSEAPSTFECAIDTGGGPVFTACTSPFSSSLFSTGNTYAFLVRATDAADNTDASPAEITWTVSNAVVTSVSPISGAKRVPVNTPIIFHFAEPVVEPIVQHTGNSAGPCTHSVCPTLAGVWSDNFTTLTYTNENGPFDKNTTYTIELLTNNGLMNGTLYTESFTTIPNASSVSGHLIETEKIIPPQEVLVPTPEKYHFLRTLKFGMQGDDVVMLQKILGITPPPSKHFGPLTRAVLIKYQKDHGLDVDGIAGPKTLAVIESKMN